MSQFLPEGYGQQQPVTGQQQAEPAGLGGKTDRFDGLLNDLLGDPDRVAQLIRSLLGDPNTVARVAPQFFGYLTSYIEQSNLLIPVSQLVGFSQFTAQAPAAVVTTETTSSTTYADLATVGPQLTGLPDGKYLVLFGAFCIPAGAGNSYMSVKVNATEAADDNAVIWATHNAPGMGFATVTCTNGSNTITARYRNSNAAQTGTWDHRKLTALKYSNV